MYNLVSRKPPPFVPRRHRFEVRERVDRHGTVLVPLDLADVEPIAAACERDGIEADRRLPPALLRPSRRTSRRSARRCASGLPGVAVTLSSEVTREWREYERTSTAVLNAYVQPAVERYLGELEQRLRRRRAARAAARDAVERRHGLARRPPARGRSRSSSPGRRRASSGAARLGERIGEPNLIYLDIGGTTAKCSLIEDGAVPTTTEYRIEWRPDWAGYPVHGAGRRHRRDRRRRRLDRVRRRGRLDRRRPAERGRRSRPGRATDAAAPSRRSPTPSSWRACSLRTTSSAAGCRCAPSSPAQALRRARRAARPRRRRARQRHHPARRREHDQRAEARLGAARARPARLRAARRRRRRRDARRGARRRARGAQGHRAAALGRVLGLGHVHDARRAPTSSARTSSATAERDRRRDRGALRRARGRRRSRRSSARGRGAPREAVCARAVDARYRGQEHTVRVPVAAGPVSAAAARGATSTRCTGASTRSTCEGDSAVELVTFHVSAHGRAPREAALPRPSRTPGLDASAEAPARRRLRPRRHGTRPPSTSATSFPSASPRAARS